MSLSAEEWTAVRLSLLVAVTAMAASLPLGVAVMTFNLPGVGYNLLHAISQRDYPLIEATTLLIAGVFVGQEDLEEMDHSGELAGLQPIDQLMSVFSHRFFSIAVIPAPCGGAVKRPIHLII